MPSPFTWRRDTMRELFALADANGESKAELTSSEDAERFRFAMYGFRRQVADFGNISITIEGKTVVLKKREEPSVSIIHEN